MVHNTRYTLEELQEKYDNEYLHVVEYHNAKNIIVQCKICGKYYKTTTSNMDREQIHNSCYEIVTGKRHERYTLDEIKTKYDDIHKEVVLYNNAKNIICKCKYCGEKYKTSLKSLEKHSIHRKCSGVNDFRRTPEKCRTKLEKLKSYKHPYIDLLEYKEYNKVIGVCKLCGQKIKVSAKSIRYYNIHRDCSCSNISSGEQRISEILDMFEVPYYQEFSFDDCKNIYPLRFDFYIPSLNMCIEYQGQQHYYPVKFPKDTEESSKVNYESIVRNDNIKNEYCKNNNIQLLIIPYTEYDNIYDILEATLSKIK